MEKESTGSPMGESLSHAKALVDELGWDAHVAVHRVVDAHLEALHACVSSPLVLAVRAMHLRRQLVSHIAFEEEHVLPLCNGELEGARANVLRDHGMIREQLALVEEAALLAHFRRVDERRVRQRLVELDGLLDHHDDREAQEIYGPLTELPSDAQARLLDRLAQTDLSEPERDDAVERTCSHATLQAVCDRYRGWLDGTALIPSARVPTSDLAAKVAASLPKLLARDDRVVAAHAEAGDAPLRERARRERLADVSLRSTITFVLGEID